MQGQDLLSQIQSSPPAHPSSPRPQLDSTKDNTVAPIPKTVTFDESPDSLHRKSQQEEKKVDDEDEDVLSPYNMDQRGSFSSCHLLSPESSEASPDSPRKSPFRMNEYSSHSLFNDSLIATPKSHDDSMMLNMSLTQRNMLQDFGSTPENNDATETNTALGNSHLSIYQQNAIDVSNTEAGFYIARIQEVEDQLKEKTDECNELTQQLNQSQAIVKELREELVGQEDEAKQQMQRLIQAFRKQLCEMAGSFDQRADSLVEKHEWAKSAVDRLLEEVDFTRHSSYYDNTSQEENVSALSSDASMTSNNEGNDLAGLETHLNFMGSPNAVIAGPVALQNSDVLRDEWAAEKEDLKREIDQLKVELELANATSNSLNEMLSAKVGDEERVDLRRENATLRQDKSKLEQDIQSKTNQLADMQRQLISVQMIGSASCKPKEAKTSRMRWPRSKARDYKIKSPIKSPRASPSKSLRDTISSLRFQIEALEAKSNALAAELDLKISECTKHETIASNLATENVKVGYFGTDLRRGLTLSLQTKEELASQKSKVNEARALYEKIEQLEAELKIAKDSSKTALKEKGLIRRQVCRHGDDV